MRARPSLTAVAAGAVGLCALVPTLYFAVVMHPLPPDAIEYLGIGHSFCEGAGFVDPVQYHYYLDLGPPLPAFSVRAPLVPLLAAVPFCLGGTLRQVQALHAVWATLIAAGVVFVAARWMSRAAAVAAALLISALPAWHFVASVPLTEATGFGALLVVLLSVRGVLRSARGALACSAASVLAWLSRPNLGIVAFIVVGAVIRQVGIRGALRSRPLRAYVGGVAGAMALIFLAVDLATGLAPYDGYGYLGQVLKVADARKYGQPYEGWLSFVAANWNAIAWTAAQRARQLSEAWFLVPSFSRLGWIALPAVLYSLARRDMPLERHVCALGALTLAAMVIVNYGSFDSLRFPLFPILLGVMCATQTADEAARALGRRLQLGAGRSSIRRHLPRLGLLALVAVYAFPEAPLERLKMTSDAIRQGALREALPPEPFCARMNRDAVVAAENPWQVFLSCGNASLWLPTDLATPGVLARFLDRKKPAYLLAARRERAALAGSQRLRPPQQFGDRILFEVRDAGNDSMPWTAPRPMRCAGLPEDCDHS